MTQGRLGLALVGSPEALEGIITDGDLRRMLVENKSLDALKASDVMNRSPQRISRDANLGAAEELMANTKIQSLIVTQSDDANAPVCGVIQIF